MSVPSQPLWKKPFNEIRPEDYPEYSRQFFQAYHRGEVTTSDVDLFKRNMQLGEGEFNVQMAREYRRMYPTHTEIKTGAGAVPLSELRRPDSDARSLLRYRIGSNFVGDLPTKLKTHLKTIGGNDFDVQEVEGPGDYSRLVISSKALGFTGPNALVMDVRGGPDSAFGTTRKSSRGKEVTSFEPAIMLRLQGGEGLESEIAIGMKLRRAEPGKWEAVNPARALADIIAGTMHAANERRNTPFHDPNEPIVPNEDLFSLLTGGEGRHAAARRRYSIPDAHVVTYATASQGEQIQNALNIGVAFQVDPKSEETEWMQLARQRAEIESDILLRGDSPREHFARMLKKGLFGFTKGEDDKFHLTKIADARLVSGDPQALMYSGSPMMNWLHYRKDIYGRVVESVRGVVEDPLSYIEKMFKHIKAGTMIAHSRMEPIPMTRDASGRLAPIQAQNIDDLVARHGERYWEKTEGATFVRSGIILPGEKEARMVQVANVMAAKTGIQGGGLVDPQMFHDIETYVADTKDVTRLSFDTLYDILEAEFQFGDLKRTVVPAQFHKDLSIGKVVYGKRVEGSQDEDFTDRTRAINIGSRAYSVHVDGGRLVLPRFYDPYSKKLYAWAKKVGDKYVNENNQELDLVENHPEMKSLAEYMGNLGIRIDYSSQGGSYFETLLRGEVGAVYKAGAADIKMGNVLFVGRERMYFQNENGKKTYLDVITGEAKQPIEMLMSAFGVVSFDSRLRLLESIGNVEIEGKGVVNVGGMLKEFAQEYRGKGAIPIDELVDYFRSITGLSGANWANIFGAMYQRIMSGDAKKAAKKAGIYVPGSGKFYGGYAAKSTADELAKSTAFEIVDSNNPNFQEVFGKVQAGKSIIMPVGLEAAVEWPGMSRDLNLESTASFEAVFPELAKRLQMTLGDLPSTHADAARRGWLGMARAFMLGASAMEGEKVKYDRSVVVDDKMLEKLRAALGDVNERDEIGTLAAIRSVLGDAPEDAVIHFGKANAFMPMPQAAEAIDLIVPTKDGLKSQAHVISQYTRAFRDLVNYETLADRSSMTRKLIDSYMRFIGSAESRIGETLGTGGDTFKLLTSRVAIGAIGGRYYGSWLLGVGQGMMDAAGWARWARSMGVRTGAQMQAFSRWLSERGDKMLAAFQRDPVIDRTAGTIGVEMVTPAWFEKRGIKLPKMPWARGAFGLSMHTTLPMQGDYDFDPGRLISGAVMELVDEEYQDELTGRKRRRKKAVFDDSAIQSDMENVPLSDPDYYQKLTRESMQGNEAWNTWDNPIKEMESDKSALGAAERMGWVNAELVERTLHAYWSGVHGHSIMIGRGTKYNERRLMEAAVAMQRLGNERYRKAMQSFALRYQKSLEYNWEAAQEPEIMSIVGRALFKIQKDDSNQLVYSLRTQIKPLAIKEAAGNEELKEDYGSLLQWSGPDSTINSIEELGRAYESVAGAEDINDELLASILANTGADSGSYQKNFERIYNRLQKARALKGEDDFHTKRWQALTGKFGGGSLFDQKTIGSESPLVQMAMSRALEKAYRDVQSRKMTATEWHAAQAVQWRGKWYSLSQLYHSDEFANLRELYAIQTGYTSDKTSPLPTAGGIVRLAEEMRAATPLAQAVHAMRKQFGFRSAEKSETPLTDTQIGELIKQPQHLRASNISAILAPLEVAKIEEDTLAREYLLSTKSHAGRALVDTALRNLAMVMGKKSFPLSVIQTAETKYTRRGAKFERWLEQEGYGVRASEAKDAEGHSLTSFSFRYTDERGKLIPTSVTGTPDLFEITDDGWLEIVEAKAYGNTDLGLHMAGIQANLYAEGLINLAKGIGPNKSKRANRKYFEEKMTEWWRLANEQRKEEGRAEIKNWRTLADKAIEAAKAGKVRGRAIVGGFHETGEGEDDGFFYIKKATINGVPDALANVLVERKPAYEYIGKVASLLGGRGFMADLIRIGSQWLAGGGPSSGAIGALAKALLYDSKGKELEAQIMAEGVDETFLRAAETVPNKLASPNVQASATIKEIRARTKNATTLVKPGERLVNARGEKSVILGDESDKPGDQFTVSQVKKRGFHIPEPVMQMLSGILGDPKQSPQANERTARLLMSEGIRAKAGEGDVDDDDDLIDETDVADLQQRTYEEYMRSGGATRFNTDSAQAPDENQAAGAAEGAAAQNQQQAQQRAAQNQAQQAAAQGQAQQPAYRPRSETMSEPKRLREVLTAANAASNLGVMTIRRKGQRYSPIESRIRNDLRRLARKHGVGFRGVSTGIVLSQLVGRAGLDAVRENLSPEAKEMLARAMRGIQKAEKGEWTSLFRDLEDHEREMLETLIQEKLEAAGAWSRDEKGVPALSIGDVLAGPMSGPVRGSLQEVMPLITAFDAEGVTPTQLHREAQPPKPPKPKAGLAGQYPAQRNFRKAVISATQDATRLLESLGLDPANAPLAAVEDSELSAEQLQGWANTIGKEGMSRLKNIASRTRLYAGYGIEVTEQMKAATEISRQLTNISPEKQAAASTRVDPITGLTPDELKNLVDGTVKSINELKTAVVDSTNVTKESLKQDQRKIERAQTHADVTEREMRARGYERAAMDIMGGKQWDDLSLEQQQQVGRLALKAHEEWKAAKREELQGAAANLETEDSNRLGVRLGNLARNVFGGYGWFYLTRMWETGMGQLSRGYGANLESQQAAWQTMTHMFGPQAPEGAYASEIQRQKALLRSGGGLGVAAANIDTALTGSGLGTIYQMGKTGGSAAMGGLFLFGEMAQAGLISKANVMKYAGALGLTAAAAYPILQQIGYITDKDNTKINAAADMMDGKMSTAGWKMFGIETVNAAKEAWQFYTDKRTYTGNWQAAAQDAAAHGRYGMDLEEAATWGAHGVLFLQGQGNLPKDPKTLMKTAQAMARSEASAFYGVDERALQNMLITAGRSGAAFTPGRIADLASAMQAGLDVRAIGKLGTRIARELPTDQNIGRNLADRKMPLTLEDQDIVELGSQFMDSFSNAFVNAVKKTMGNKYDMVRRFAGMSVDDMAPFQKAAEASFARAFMTGRDPHAYTPDELARLKTPAGREALFAELARQDQVTGIRETLLSGYGVSAREALLGAEDMAQRYGNFGALIAQRNLGIYNQAMLATGGSTVTSGAIYNLMNNLMATGQYGVANQFQGAMSGDPVALQMMMQRDPRMAATMTAAGFPQVADVNRLGQVTGLPLYTTNMVASESQKIWGQNWQGTIGQYAVNGYTPLMSSTGEMLYGARAIQAKMADDSYLYQQQMFGFQWQQIGMQQQYMTQSWRLEDQMRALSHRQTMWGFEHQLAGMDLQRSQFYENQALNRKGAAMSRAFTQWEWGQDDLLRDLKWQWRQEDFGEEVRFMTGRQRRLAERQMKRDTIVHNLEEDRIDKQREQQQALWKLEDERFALQKKHFEEDQKFQRESIEKQRQFYLERHRLEEQQMQLQRRYQQQQLQMQQQQLRLQQQYAQATHKSQTEMAQLSQAVDDTVAGLRTAWEYTDIIKQVLDNIAQFARDMGYDASTGNFSGQASRAVGGTGGSGLSAPTLPVTSAGGGELMAGESSIVGENGPELITAVRNLYVHASSHRNPWQKAIEPYKDAGRPSGGGPITLIVNLGDEQLFSRVIQAVSQEISI